RDLHVVREALNREECAAGAARGYGNSEGGNRRHDVANAEAQSQAVDEPGFQPTAEIEAELIVIGDDSRALQEFIARSGYGQLSGAETAEAQPGIREHADPVMASVQEAQQTDCDLLLPDAKGSHLRRAARFRHPEVVVAEKISRVDGPVIGQVN